MLRGEKYFLSAENGGRGLTKKQVLDCLQEYTKRDENHPVREWSVKKALMLIAGMVPEDELLLDQPSFTLDGDDRDLVKSYIDAKKALALTLDECEAKDDRSLRVRRFDADGIRFSLRMDSSADLLNNPEEALAQIEHHQLPLHFYAKVAERLFSDEFYFRDVPLFGFFHDDSRESGGSAVLEAIDCEIREQLKRSLRAEQRRYCDLLPMVRPGQPPEQQGFRSIYEEIDLETLEGDASGIPDDVLLNTTEIPDVASWDEPTMQADSANEDELEIIPGVTVGDMRRMLDEKSPAYCPRLLAAIKTKIGLMPREQEVLTQESVYGRFARRESVRFLKELGVVNTKDKSKDPAPATEDEKAVARILGREKARTQGRPNNC